VTTDGYQYNTIQYNVSNAAAVCNY